MHFSNPVFRKLHPELFGLYPLYNNDPGSKVLGPNSKVSGLGSKFPLEFKFLDMLYKVTSYWTCETKELNYDNSLVKLVDPKSKIWFKLDTNRETKVIYIYLDLANVFFVYIK